LRGSGRFARIGSDLAEARVFQSPSLRGSGRFAARCALPSGCSPSFNPLHCGAVVASCDSHYASGDDRSVSIPFIAGQWSLQPILAVVRTGHAVFQSPSLRGSGRFAASAADSSPGALRFNPLHCGAVVASTRRRDPARVPRPCFNPLHCGAVVASGRSSNLRVRPQGFQSPSLRGSGRFGPTGTCSVVRRRFQSPSLRGSGRFLPLTPALRKYGVFVSIPFIAGQWSLPVGGYVGVESLYVFQSPSLRGSGRFPLSGPSDSSNSSRFQSPSLRGSGRFPMACPVVIPGPPVFQSPSLRGSGRFLTSRLTEQL